MKYQALTILLNPDTHIPAKYVAGLVFFICYFYLKNLLFPRTAVTLFFTAPFFLFNFCFLLIINSQEERIASLAALWAKPSTSSGPRRSQTSMKKQNRRHGASQLRKEDFVYTSVSWDFRRPPVSEWPYKNVIAHSRCPGGPKATWGKTIKKWFNQA